VADQLVADGDRSYTAEKFSESAALYARALAIREKTLGPEHIEVARTLTKFAGAYVCTGKGKQAEAVLKRALAIHEKASVPDPTAHADTLAVLATVKLLLESYREAEALLKRALAMREKALGPEHPDVAKTFDQLGLVLGMNSKYKESLDCFQRAVEIQTKTLGREHPDLATTLNDEGVIGHIIAIRARWYRKGEDTKPIESFVERGLKIREKSLGAHHSKVAESLNTLAVMYVYQKRYAEAEVLLERAVEILEKTDPEGLITAHTIDSYVHVLRKSHLNLRTWAAAQRWAARSRSIRAAHPSDVVITREGSPPGVVATQEASPSAPPSLR